MFFTNNAINIINTICCLIQFVTRMTKNVHDWYAETALGCVHYGSYTTTPTMIVYKWYPLPVVFAWFNSSYVHPIFVIKDAHIRELINYTLWSESEVMSS